MFLKKIKASDGDTKNFVEIQLVALVWFPCIFMETTLGFPIFCVGMGKILIKTILHAVLY